MSEYQFYTFLAIDRPLSTAEQAALRRVSTRAEITAHRFTNVYRWGNLKADPDDLVDRYFDAHLYATNWGTFICQLRLPIAALPPDSASPYATSRSLTVRHSARHTVVTFERQDEDPDYWEEDHDALSGLLPLRTDLACGDLRALYLGWLLGVQQGDVDDDAVEPAVPPDLLAKSKALAALAAFLDLDPDLLAVAAAASPQSEPVDGEAVQRWLAGLPTADKDAWLTAIMQGEGIAVASSLWTRFRQPWTAADDGPAPQRTAGELLAAADRHRIAREKREADAADARAKKKALARRRYLDGLLGNEESLWAQADQATAAADYDTAARISTDLNDLRALTGDQAAFGGHYMALKKRYSRKSGLWRRLNEAGVSG